MTLVGSWERYISIYAYSHKWPLPGSRGYGAPEGEGGGGYEAQPKLIAQESLDAHCDAALFCMPGGREGIGAGVTDRPGVGGEQSPKRWDTAGLSQ